MSQSNVQAVTAENEEHYTSSNVIYIKFQNCCFFSLISILKEVLLKRTQTNWKIFAMEFIFLTKVQAVGLRLYQKYTPL